MTFRSGWRIIIFVAFLTFVLIASPNCKGPSVRAMVITSQHVLDLLNDCNKVGGGYPAQNDKPATFSICESNDIVYWDAGMTIDCDGVITEECSRDTDPDFISDTTLHDSNDRPLDAAHLPYVVAPFPDEHWNFRENGIGLGAPVAIIYRGRIECGVLGDLGTMGEASYAMAQNLGIDPDPYDGGTDAKMTYIVFKHARISPAEDHAAAVGQCKERLAQFIQKKKKG